jgi:YD repeat-containing protein
MMWVSSSGLKTSDGTPRERVQYGFDRASNRVWRDNLVGTSNQDEYYIYDNLYQLKTLKRGNLNAGKTDISGTPVWQEDWNYDPTGNWRGATSAYVTRVNGSTTLDQNRSHDKANEILTLTGTPDWVDPTHDAAGNMTKLPQPATPTSSYDCRYDAWDRLVEVKVTGGAVVATYRYDGLKRRVTKVAGGNTRHYYYSNRWQVLEERLNALTTADRQFVWGLRHVDDLILRDRGSERFYVLHDHLSVTAIINTTVTAPVCYYWINHAERARKERAATVEGAPVRECFRRRYGVNPPL